MGINSIKTVVAAILGTVIPLAGIAQSANQNYILTRTYKSGSAYFDDIQYYDGLGRPMETVQKQFTPGSKDLVSRIEYDAYGREYKQWLPAPNSKSDGTYNGSTAGVSYYSDNNPFSEIVYESSPLNRVKDQYGPGAAWRTGSHKVTTEYMTNKSGDATLNCPNYYATDGNNFTKTTDYATGQLYVAKTTDEDGNISYEFTDKSGRVLLQRRMSGSTKYDTNYIYDNFGNLGFILPPVVSDALTTNQAYGYWATYNNIYLPDLVYSFCHDERNRRDTEAIPGATREASVYDTADRLVMCQTDAVEISGTGEMGWLFYKYDAFGRVVLSGIYHGDDTSVKSENNRVYDMRIKFKTLLSKESPSAAASDFHYTWSTFPAKNQSEVTRVYFYDNYTYAADNTGISSNSGSLVYQAKTNYGTQHTSAQGLLTGTWEQLSDGSGWIKTTYYYDAFGNLVQKRSTNNKSGYDYEYYAYNYNNQVTKKYVEHTALGQAAITEEYNYEYDARLRLTKVKYKFNGGTEVNMAEYQYNDLGQMKEKKTGGGKEIAAFTYNLRGWQTAQTGQRFSENLYYTTNPKSGGATYYNGNVSALTWRTESTTSTLRGYAFKYNALGWLTDAVYGEGTTLSTGTLKYDEYFTYNDKNGNIKTLKRYGMKDNNSFGLIDDLNITEYKGNLIRKVTDAAGYQTSSDVMEFKKTYTGTAAEYVYWGGRLNSDYNRNICMIKYNYLNLPKSVQFRRGDRIEYVYDAGGMKRQTTHKVSKTDLNYGYWSQDVPAASNFDATKTVTTNYFGNKVYVNNQLKYVLTEEGYIEKTTGGSTYNAFYYLNDHLGSHRVVMDASGNIKQINNFYPSGTSMAERRTDQGVQPYKFSGKELDRFDNLDFYDFDARAYNPVLMRFTRTDPMAEKYPGMSPYAYCANNPVLYVDRDGRDISFSYEYEKDKDGNYVINKNGGYNLIGVTMNVTGKVINISSNSKVDMQVATNRISNQITSSFSGEVDGVPFSTNVNLSVANSMDDVAESDHVFALTDKINSPLGTVVQGASSLPGGKVAFIDVDYFTGPLDTNIGNIGPGTAAHEFGHLAGIGSLDSHPKGWHLMMENPGGIFWMNSTKVNSGLLKTIRNKYEAGLLNRGSNWEHQRIMSPAVGEYINEKMPYRGFANRYISYR